MSAIALAHADVFGAAVVQVACREHYSAALTQSGALFTWGRGDSGQLGYVVGADGKQGGGARAASRIPVMVPIPESIVAVSLGWDHACAISSSGALFSWGANPFGQLGHNDELSRSVPTRVEALAKRTVSQVDCGWSFTVCVTDDSSVYSWGVATAGQLGHPKLRRRRVPTKIDALADVPVQEVACGENYCAALTVHGALYTWGCGEDGRLGQGDRTSRPLPTLLSMAAAAAAAAAAADGGMPPMAGTFGDCADMAVLGIACGYRHMAARTSNGMVLTWGCGQAGRLGHGNTDDCLVPALVVLNPNADPHATGQAQRFQRPTTVCSVSCGYKHTAVCCENGDTYIWGLSDNGRLGLGTGVPRELSVPQLLSSSAEQPPPTPGTEQSFSQLNCLNGRKLVGLACGTNHTLAVSTDGFVFAWGAMGVGDWGQLGAEPNAPGAEAGRRASHNKGRRKSLGASSPPDVAMQEAAAAAKKLQQQQELESSENQRLFSASAIDAELAALKHQRKQMRAVRAASPESSVSDADSLGGEEHGWQHTAGAPTPLPPQDPPPPVTYAPPRPPSEPYVAEYEFEFVDVAGPAAELPPLPPPLHDQQLPRSPSGADASQQLIAAARDGWVEELEALVSSGVALDAQDQTGLSALHWAARGAQGTDPGDDIRCLSVLLTMCPSAQLLSLLAARDETASTPLIKAAATGRVSAVEMLLEAGAVPTVRNADGFSALDLAQRWAQSPDTARDAETIAMAAECVEVLQHAEAMVATKKAQRVEAAAVAQPPSKVANVGTVHVRLLEASALPKVDAFWWCNPYAILRLGTQQHRSSVKKRTKAPRWDDAPFDFDCTEASSDSLEVLVCSWDGQNEDQLVGSATIQLSTEAIGTSSDDAAPLQYPLTDDAGRQRGVVVVSCWRSPIASDSHEAPLLPAAAMPVATVTAPSVPAANPRGASLKEETRRRIAVFCRVLRFNHSLCLGAALRRWAVIATEAAVMISPSKAMPDSPAPTATSQTDELVLTRAIQGLHQKLHRQSVAQAARLLGLTLGKRCQRFIRLAWSSWMGGVLEWRAAKRASVLQKQLAACRSELRDQVYYAQLHHLRALCQRPRPRMAVLAAGFEKWRCTWLLAKTADTSRLGKRDEANKKRHAKERYEVVIRDHVSELFTMMLRFGRDKLCGVFLQRTRHNMRLAFERWHMRVAIRRKEESLKRGHVKLQIELDQVRGQRAALADTSAELQRAQLQLTTQAAEHARELERVRQSRSDEVTKAEKQVEVMFGKLQKLHERMQQVREVEDTAFKAASSRGEVMIKNLGALETKLQGTMQSTGNL